jgi:hypothetical protein
MGSLSGCLKTHAAAISEADRDAILEARRALMASSGLKATPAAVQVVRDMLGQAEAMLASLAEPAESTAVPAPEQAERPPAEQPAPTEADLQVQAAAEAAAKAAIEARRVSRETERDIFRTLVANPELVGMSLKNVEALVYAKAGDVISPAKRALLARAIAKEVAKQAAELAKQKHRDPAVFGAALGAAKEQDNVGDDPAMQAAYALGWTHALQGKTKSTLTGDNLGVRVAGYDAAQAWMKTEEGAAWYEGRPVNKLQNTGMDLRRWYEQLQAQIKPGERDIQKAWKQIDRATTRADLFAPLLPDGVTPGFRLYVNELRDLVRPFKAWLDAAYSWDGNSASRHSSKSNLEYMLAGDRYPSTYSYRKKVTETDSDQFQTDEAFRAEWLRQRAAEYVEQVRGITSVIEGTSSVAEAAQKWHERFISKFTDKRWNTDPSMLTAAGQNLVTGGSVRHNDARIDAWTGETSDVMQFSPEHGWTKNLIDNEKTVDLPNKATPLTTPRLDKISREGGPDLRKGENVTPEQFKAAFGMADVGFGRWVGAKEDQDHLNYSFDAFQDLSRHFGVDPKNLGFGGALHFTIGALGHGKHAAHFSPNQPSPVGPVQVINVTNTKGDGTVYHEWIHALDHFLFGAHFVTQPDHPVRKRVLSYLKHGALTPEAVEARARQFLTGGRFWKGDKKGSKVDAARHGLRSWQRSQSAYKTNADKLGNNYWETDHELLARASEAWAYDTLGHASTYLVNPWVEDGKVTQAAGYRGTPYPTGAERKQFNLVLGALAKAVKWADGRPSVSLADFDAALPDDIKAGERRRVELMQPEAMQAYYDQILAEKADKEAQAARNKAEADAAEQRRLDDLAAQKLRELEPPPATVDAPQPSEAQGPLSDEELSNLFDQAAAELREETQEQPEVPATAEPEITRPEWTAEDWRAVHRLLAKGTPVLLAQEGHGIPTIHEFARLGKTDMVGFGVFKTVGDGWTANWDGGSAMDRTPSGMAYTTVQFSGGAIPAGVYDMQAAADAALANARALESVSSVSSVPALPAAQSGAQGGVVIANFKKVRDFDAWLAQEVGDEYQLARETPKGKLKDQGVKLLVLDPGKQVFNGPTSSSGASTVGADVSLVYQLMDGRLVWWDNKSGDVQTVSPSDPRLEPNPDYDEFVPGKSGAEASGWNSRDLDQPEGTDGWTSLSYITGNDGTAYAAAYRDIREVRGDVREAVRQVRIYNDNSASHMAVWEWRSAGFEDSALAGLRIDSAVFNYVLSDTTESAFGDKAADGDALWAEYGPSIVREIQKQRGAPSGTVREGVRETNPDRLIGQGSTNPDTKSDPTARELIAKAAELGVKGADEALTGLAKLFGSKPGRLNSFPAGFDEEAYNEAKPHFRAALNAFQEAGKTLKDLFKFLIQNLGDGVKQYAIQFAKDEALGNNLAPQDKTAQSLALARDIERHLLHVTEPMDWRTLFNMADRAFGGTQAEDKYTPKDAYDALEVAINMRILRSPTLFTPGVNEEDAQRTVAALTRLIEKIPTQTKRTEEQDRLQQFSTVPPLAFVANWVANVRATDVMGEPSAGLGGLAVFAKNAGARVVLNEWSARRAALLQQLFPDSRVFQEDADQLHNILPDDVQPTVVVMNPPFSNSTGGIKDTMTGANHVEQMLKRLPDGGRLVAIVGEGMARDKASFKGWWKKIDARYDVRAAIPMDGKGYAKYGTTFDNVILVIDKVDPSGRKPIVTPAKEYTELVHLLAEVRNDRPEADAPQQDHSLESDPRGGAGDGVSAGDGPAVPADGATAGDGGTADLGAGQPGGQPGMGGSGAAGGRSGRGGRPRGTSGGDRTGGAAADPNANGSGPADAAVGGGSGAAGSATGLTVESADTAAANTELTDSVFEGYQPKFLRIPGAKPHPGALVESSAMSSVNPPRPTYTPNLPKETIEKGLVSLAQLESTVYAGQAHSQLLEAKVGDVEARDFNLTPGVPYRRGFFIGDGTGVGKGREISAILLDNIRQGRKKHVWVSEKQGLMNDAARDFAGIQEGVTPSALLKNKTLFNQNEAKADEAIKQADGILFTTYSTLRSAAQNVTPGGYKKGDAVEVGRAFGPPGSPDFDNTKLVKIDKKKYTVTVEWPGGKKIEHPFAQILAINGDRSWTNTISDKAKKPKTRIDQLVDWLGPDFDGVIAFDEAHNAGNAVEIKGERGSTEPSAQAMAVVELQRRLPGARVVYVSATGATEVSNLSFANRLGIWGPGTPFASVKEFISNMVAGGLATMELVARDLKQTGSYMARSLSFDGVTYSRLEHELSQDQHDIYNRITDAWQVVLNNMEEAMKATGILSEGGKTKNSKAKSAALSAFWGAQQRFFNQIITSMQMPSVLESVEADLARGDAVVLQLVNTNEAQQERAMAKKTEDGEEAELDDLDLTPRDALIDMVRKAFPVNQYRDVINDEGKRVTELALDSEGNPIQNKEMVANRDVLIKDLQDIKVPDGPLELLVNHFGPEVVAEITGRKQRVVVGRWNKNHKGEGEPKAYVERLGGAKVRADADAFMADKKRILVFSDAGGTGFSFQADLGKANQRKRQHYLIQPGWRANKAVQGLGRTHRTNQKSAPHYKLVATNIPAHKRFLSSIARRLDQLGALTKGQRDTSSGGLFSEKDNLESKYAERAVRRFLEDAMIGQIEGVNFQELLQQLGLKDMINAETRQIVESKVPGVRQFLNRLLSLSLEMQDKVFGAFIARMEQTIEEANQRGELDTGMQTIRALETRVVSEDTIYTDERTGADTNLVEIEATHPTRMYDFPEIRNTEKDAGYVVNVRSGRVWKKARSGTVTLKNGQVVERYWLDGTGGSASRTEEDFKDKAGWRTLTEPEARAMWEKENAAKPPTYTTRTNLIVGAMLPIWDRLKTDGIMQVARTQTVDGRRLLGRVVHKDDIAELRKRLNLASPESKLAPAEVLARVLKGETAELANNWRLERARVSDDLRVEIKGMPAVGPALTRELTDAGVIVERISWNTRYFIPVNKPEVLAAVIKNRPVVALAKPSDEPKLSQLKQLPAGEGVPAPEVREMAARVAAAWANNPDAPAVYVVENAYRLPQDILRSLSNMGAIDSTRGLVMPDGRVFLVADKLRSIDEAQSILFHEVYGHMGLRAFLGEQYGAQMMLLRMANPRLAGEANTWYANYGRGQIAVRVKAGMSREEAERVVRLLAVEEALADRAGDAPPPSAWKAVMAKLQEALRRLGLGKVADMLERMTEAETYALLMNARRAIDRTGGPMHALSELPATMQPRRAAEAPPFFSALLAEVNKAPMKAGPASAWGQYLDALAKKGAVKADEIEWTGLREWLQMQEGKVTKDQVGQFLAANGVQVTETVLGDAIDDTIQRMREERNSVEAQLDRLGFEMREEYGEPILHKRVNKMDFLWEDGEFVDEDGEPMAKTDAEARDLAIRYGMLTDQMEQADSQPSQESRAKYGQYTLPGGTNYREVLLTLPVKETYRQRYEVRQKEDGNWGVWAALGPTPSWAGGPGQVFKKQEWAQEQADILNAQSRNDGPRPIGYKSAHWDQPNILANIRLNDRTDADGKRVLFVEEIQSDWGQAGKKVRDEKVKALAAKDGISIEAADKLVPKDAGFNAGEQRKATTATWDDAGYWEVRDQFGGFVTNVVKYDLRPGSTERDAVNEGQRRLFESEGQTGPEKRVPRAPFIGKTDAWVALAIKRVISIAAREGYDRVAFVNGEQSASRYALSTQVNSIEWTPASGMGVVEGATHVILDTPKGLMRFNVSPAGQVQRSGNGGLDTSSILGKQLDAVLGKPVAEKIMGAYRGKLEGEGLNLGGQGMRSFYGNAEGFATDGYGNVLLDDKGKPQGAIVPAVAKDVLRKVGGGSIGVVALKEPRYTVVDAKTGFAYEPTVSSRERAESLAEGWNNKSEYQGVEVNAIVRESKQDQPGFDITPAMREKAATGLPLFKQVRSRADVAWARVDRNTEGPEFYGNGVGLIAIQELSTDDFAPDHLALPMGHAYRVQPGHSVHRFLVTDDTGAQVLGIAALEVDGSGQIEAIHDIEVDAKGSGTGRRVVEAILASAPGEVRLIDIIEQAVGFWDRMGAGYRNVYGDATTDWAALQAQDARTVPGARPRAGQGLEAGRSAEGQLRGGQEGGTPLLSQIDPVTDAALKKAGIRPALTLGEKIRAFYGRAVEAVRHPGELGTEFRQGALDQFYGIQRAVAGEIGNLPVEQNPYITARMANGGTSSVMRALLLHGQARWGGNGQHLEKIPGTVGLLDILQPLGKDIDLFFGWMVGNRAARLMTEGRENNLTADEIKALQALGTPERLPAFQTAAREYAAFKRSVLDVAQEAGLIDAEARRAWDHADYIPFYREIDERSVFSPTGKKGLAGQSSGIRKLKGGESALNDPMENLLMNFSRLIDASLKNNAIRKTIQTLGETDLVTKVGYDMTAALVPRKQVVDVLAAAGTPDSILASLPDEVYEGISKMWAIKAPTDPDVVRVMMGGKPVFFRINDSLLLRALTSFVPFDFPGLALMRGAKRLLTAMVTSTPEFMARNWIRDSLASQAITKSPFNPLKSVLAIREAYKEGPGYEAMLFAGASFQSGNINAGDPEATGVSMRRSLRTKGMAAFGQEGLRQAAADKAVRGWESYRKAGEAIENANREAVYEAAIRGGKSVTEAAFEAKDLMDFSLRGSWAGYQLLADVVPFLNARVQGLYRLGRSDPKRLMMVGTMMMVATAILALFNSGEDWYERLPDWEKDGYWHVMTPAGRFKIPKPFEIGVIFATVPERIARNFLGLDSNKKTLSRLWANVRDQLAFDVMPWKWQLFKPVYEVGANKDTFRERDIEGMADEGKRPHARFDARTSDTMRVLADVAEPVVDFVDLGPKKMEHLIGGYFGTVGLWGLAVADSVVRAAEDKPARPAHRLDDLPMVRAFYAEDPPKATVYESDVYKMRREVEAIVKEARALAKSQEMGKAKELMAEEAGKIKAYGAVVGGAKSLSALNQQISQVYIDPKLDADQKRAKVDALLAQKAKLAQKVATNKAVQAAF